MEAISPDEFRCIYRHGFVARRRVHDRTTHRPTRAANAAAVLAAARECHADGVALACSPS